MEVKRLRKRVKGERRREERVRREVKERKVIEMTERVCVCEKG